LDYSSEIQGLTNFKCESSFIKTQAMSNFTYLRYDSVVYTTNSVIDLNRWKTSFWSPILCWKPSGMPRRSETTTLPDL